ncbi:MAG TPA: type II toxin-antitoxin system HicA family toxin [Spirochaetales bacterium]|nr:type II toxin-antitoxin system HicA family toxin [Spirochaetales bacterium]
MKGKDLVKLMEKNGWEIVRITGSHYIMKKSKETLVVPVHSNTDLKTGILNSLLKKAGLQ